MTGERKRFQQMALGKLEAHVLKNEIRPESIASCKINSKWNRGLNMKPEAARRKQGWYSPVFSRT